VSAFGLREGTVALAVCMWVLCAGCGDDSGPGGPGANATDAIPRSWGPAARFGYALLSVQDKSPLDLTAEHCTVDTQMAVASAAGALPDTDSEGPCVVTDTFTLEGLAPDPMPACAGVVAMEYGGTTRRITVCGDAFTAPLEVDCTDASLAGDLRVTSGPGEIEGDVIGSLDVTAQASGTPFVQRPEPQGMGSALWPAGSLDLGWTIAGADGVEIVIGATSGTGPQVRCLVPDTGSFTVPERLVAPYRSASAFVELAALGQARQNANGFDVTVTVRRSDAIWLYPPAP